MAAVRDVLPPRLYDITQNEGSHGRANSWLCTLLRETAVWSEKKQRMLVGQGHVVAQGILGFPNLTHEGLSVCPYAEASVTMPQTFMKELAGNAICVPVFGALLAFALSGMERRVRVQLGSEISLAGDEPDCLLTNEDDNEQQEVSVSSSSKPVAGRCWNAAAI